MPSLAFAYVEETPAPTYNETWIYVLGHDGNITSAFSKYDETHYQSTCSDAFMKVHVNKADSSKYDEATAVVLEAAAHHATKYVWEGGAYKEKAGRVAKNKDCLKGSWDDVYCVDCDKVVVEEKNLVPAAADATHSFEKTPSKVSDATCTDNQVNGYKCSVCGAWEKTWEVPETALGHEIVLPEADKDGKYDLDAISKMSGKYTPATCISDATYTATCANGCGEEKTIVVSTDRPAHVYNHAVVTPATCTDPEMTTKYCTTKGCDAHQAAYETGKAKGHTLVADPENSKAATCTEAGVEAKKCSVEGCTYTETKEIPAKGHKFAKVRTQVSPATCTEDEVLAYKCQNGCKEYSDPITGAKATGHKLGGEEFVKATCTEKAYAAKKCSGCNAYFEARALTDADKTSLKNYNANQVEPAGHVMVLSSVEDATCAKAGAKTYKCTACGETQTEAIAKLPHTLVKDAAVAATSTKTGLTAGEHCSVCNEVVTAQKVTVAKAKTPTVKAGKKKLTVTASNVTGATKYQVAYKQSGKSWKYATASTKNAQTIKSLKSGKKYYVKVRTISGSVKGAWSSTKSVKVK